MPNLELKLPLSYIHNIEPYLFNEHIIPTLEVHLYQYVYPYIYHYILVYLCHTV